MKTKTIVFSILVVIVIGMAGSCKKEKSSDPVVSTRLELPDSAYSYGFGNNDIPTLGRVLFYDTRLSVNNSISCGSCHKQALAFSDSKSLSRGFENKLTKRNTPPIQNVALNGFSSGSELFWDGRESFLPSMVMKPIMNHVEMGMYDEDALVKKINSLPYYQHLFSKAYGSPTANAINVANAISSFASKIISQKSKFEKVQSSKATLSGLEFQGQQLFEGKYNCNSCHNLKNPRGYNDDFLPSGQSSGFVNIGLDKNYQDNGRGDITHNPSDNGKFKIPNLRNVALTAPYMHDGRFATLDEVLEHYSHNIVQHPNLDFRLKDEVTGTAKQMNISTHDKEALVAFLNSLTDYELITDPKFSNPFRVN